MYLSSTGNYTAKSCLECARSGTVVESSFLLRFVSFIYFCDSVVRLL